MFATLSLKSETPAILQLKLLSFLFENSLILESEHFREGEIVEGMGKAISFPYGKIPSVCTAPTCLPFNLYPYMYAARY